MMNGEPEESIVTISMLNREVKTLTNYVNILKNDLDEIRSYYNNTYYSFENAIRGMKDLKENIVWIACALDVDDSYRGEEDDE